MNKIKLFFFPLLMFLLSFLVSNNALALEPTGTTFLPTDDFYTTPNYVILYNPNSEFGQTINPPNYVTYADFFIDNWPEFTILPQDFKIVDFGGVEGNSLLCTALTYNECILLPEVESYGEYTLAETLPPPVGITAISTLNTVASVAGNSTISLATWVFQEIWPFAIMIIIVGGLLKYINWQFNKKEYDRKY